MFHSGVQVGVPGLSGPGPACRDSCRRCKPRWHAAPQQVHHHLSHCQRHLRHLHCQPICPLRLRLGPPLSNRDSTGNCDTDPHLDTRPFSNKTEATSSRGSATRSSSSKSTAWMPLKRPRLIQYVTARHHLDTYLTSSLTPLAIHFHVSLLFTQ
jgi:hypothetical protein